MLPVPQTPESGKMNPSGLADPKQPEVAVPQRLQDRRQSHTSPPHHRGPGRHANSASLAETWWPRPSVLLAIYGGGVPSLAAKPY